MKSTKAHGLLSWITGKGTYKETKFDEDAEKIIEYYRNKGYIAARVGQPEIKTLEDSKDKETRWVQLNIPVDEGPRYRVGEFKFDGNKIIKTEFLEPLFKLKAGDWYSEKPIRKGLMKAREVLRRRRLLRVHRLPGSRAGRRRPRARSPVPREPTVNVTMRMKEGEQYFVNRLTFTGNTTTRDNVIRREVRLLEGAPFNTEALKYSVKRLNQLGYFKPLEEGQGVDVQKTPGEKNQVDVTLKLEEQNRNQLTFGAGVSQFEGFFGQLSFQTSNFLGRGESLTLSLQVGSRAENYQVAFTEPFLFDRNITGGVDVYKRTLRYIDQFTQEATGGNLTTGFPAGRLLAHVHDLQLRGDDGVGPQSDLLRARAGAAQSVPARLAADRRGRPAHDQQDDAELRPQHGRQPDLPEHRHAPHRVDRLRRPRRQHQLHQAARRIRAASSRSTAARRSASARRSNTSGRTASTTFLPITETLYLGGEYTIRGFDIRSIGPRDPETGLVLGGNKRLLFNAEYLINIAGPVRLVLFYDTGQVRNIGQSVRVEGRHQRPRRSERAADHRSVHDDAADRSECAAAVPAEGRRDQRVQDLDGRRDPLLHAGAERAVPVDLRV